jgi:hypothetical protein
LALVLASRATPITWASLVKIRRAFSLFLTVLLAFLLLFDRVTPYTHRPLQLRLRFLLSSVLWFVHAHVFLVVLGDEVVWVFVQCGRRGLEQLLLSESSLPLRPLLNALSHSNLNSKHY